MPEKESEHGGHAGARHGDASPAHRGHHHRKAAPDRVPTLVVTVSDTRTLETDTGGALVESMLREAGQPVVARRIVPDEPEAIRRALDEAIGDPGCRAVVFTGGTGVAPRDVTPDTIEPLLERVVPGFGELFRMLSYEDIGSAALLSRALAGLSAGKVVFVIPGSRGAVRLALEKLILPELGHLAGEAVKSR
ncbi:MAG: molybdenum cofactor biosynthesis protein B [Myxococcota bacterium]